MNTQMMICMVIFAATLVSYMMNKIPMWLTAMLSLTALYFTGCIDATGALAGFSNANTLLMATMFIVAAGFRRTSLVDGMCDAIMKLTRGSFLTAYFGYILIAVLLTNFIASPMVVYAIVSPLLAALCDNTGHSRTQYPTANRSVFQKPRSPHHSSPAKANSPSQPSNYPHETQRRRKICQN